MTLADTRSAAERDAARNRAQKHFAASDQRDAEVKHIIESERSAMDAKTAKLRALRLARDEAERVAAANAPPAAPVKTRARKSRSKSA